MCKWPRHHHGATPNRQPSRRQQTQLQKKTIEQHGRRSADGDVSLAPCRIIAGNKARAFRNSPAWSASRIWAATRPGSSMMVLLCSPRLSTRPVARNFILNPRPHGNFPELSRTRHIHAREFPHHRHPAWRRQGRVLPKSCN